MPSRGPSNLPLSARFTAVNPFGKPKRPVATFMTASLSPLQQASKQSKIHLRKMSGPKLVSSPDQNHHCQKLTHTHTQMIRKIPHSFPSSSSSSYFVLCASFVFLSSLNYYYYYGAIFSVLGQLFPESGTTFDLL